MTLTEEKQQAALNSKPGDKWKNRATQRVVEVVEAGRTMKLRHQDGRITTKQHHYFAYDYDPITSN